MSAWPVPGCFVAPLTIDETTALATAVADALTVAPADPVARAFLFDATAASGFLDTVEALVLDYRRKRDSGPGPLRAAELRRVGKAAAALAAAIDELNDRERAALGGLHLKSLNGAVAALTSRADEKAEQVRLPRVTGKAGAPASGRGPRVNYELVELAANLAVEWQRATARPAGYSMKGGACCESFLRVALPIAEPDAGPGAIETALRRAIEHARNVWQDEAL
jgi:hypothetical protein